MITGVVEALLVLVEGGPVRIRGDQSMSMNIYSGILAQLVVCSFVPAVGVGSSPAYVVMRGIYSPLCIYNHWNSCCYYYTFTPIPE